MKYRRVCSLIWMSIKLCMVTVHRARVDFCLTLYRLQGVWKSNTTFRGHHGISKTINLSKNCQRGTTCKVPFKTNFTILHQHVWTVSHLDRQETGYIVKHSKLNRILCHPGRLVNFFFSLTIYFCFFLLSKLLVKWCKESNVRIIFIFVTHWKKVCITDLNTFHHQICQ